MSGRLTRLSASPVMPVQLSPRRMRVGCRHGISREKHEIFETALPRTLLVRQSLANVYAGILFKTRARSMDLDTDASS
jgi:hypothetical protein